MYNSKSIGSNDRRKTPANIGIIVSFVLLFTNDEKFKLLITFSAARVNTPKRIVN